MQSQDSHRGGAGGLGFRGHSGDPRDSMTFKILAVSVRAVHPVELAQAGERPSSERLSMVMKTDGCNGDPASGNGSIAKSRPAASVLRGPDGRWMAGTASPTLGTRRDPAVRIRQRILDAIEGAKGTESLESVLDRMATEKPVEYMKLVRDITAPEHPIGAFVCRPLDQQSRRIPRLDGRDAMVRRPDGVRVSRAGHVESETRSLGFQVALNDCTRACPPGGIESSWISWAPI